MDNPTCIIDDCTTTKTVARQLCGKHYQQMAKAGRLEEFVKPPRKVTPLPDRFRRIGWTAVESGCWEWKGSRDDLGYGRISRGRRDAQGRCQPMLAYRVAYSLSHGEIPEGGVILHECDNPPCVNPAHLRLGTKADNNRDMAVKRRTANGERRPQSKLTDEQVAEIRALYAQGGLSQRAIGAMYGVADSNVSLIVNYKRRAHETYPVPRYYRAA